MTRILAVASGGGHWQQLMLLRDALGGQRLDYATCDTALADQHGITNAHRLPDCNQNQPLRLLWCWAIASMLILRLRPDVVISTGAAPGFFCILMGRIFGAKTLWIDSIANADELSMSGKLSLKVAHQCLTQWQHLSTPGGPRYFGALL